MNVNQVYSGAVSQSISKEDLRDNILINGRVMDIMGNMTDEQIEAVMKVGYNNAVNQMIDIITTCSDITDKELIDLFLGKANATGVPNRLRIIRKTPTPAPAPSNPTDPTDPENPADPTNPDDPADPDNPDSGDDEGEKTLGPEKPDESDVNVILRRKCSSGNEVYKQTISIDSMVKNIKLTNTFDGKDYYYKISSLSATHNITLEYMDNGRLLIIGDFVKVEAIDSQNDDIILIGSNCEIDTNSGNDTVRLGSAKDSTLSEENQSDNNKVTTGSGKDYVQTFGINDINLGGNNGDTLKYIGATISEYSSYGAKVTGAENIWDDRGGGIGVSDGKLGTAGQGGYGDCKFLSFLNSFKIYLEKNPSKKLSDYVTITPEENNYKVTFEGSGKFATVTKSELQNAQSELEKLLIKDSRGGSTIMTIDKNNLSGDIDNVIIEIAFRKLITDSTNNSNNNIYNIDNYEDNEYVEGAGYTYNVKADGRTSFYGTNYSAHNNQMFGALKSNWLISEHFFGTQYSGCVMDDATYGISFEDTFKFMLEKFKAGEVSNFVLGTSDAAASEEAHRLGPHEGHAYCVKDGVANQWVELCNPWDSNDSFKLDWDDFLTYYSSIHLFGDAYDICAEAGYHMYVVDSTLDPSNNMVKILTSDNGISQVVSTTSIDLESLFYASAVSSESNLNIFANLFNDEPTIYDEIDEITASIENVKEILEDKKTLELYS